MPASADGIGIPLGIRQLQTVDLKAWAVSGDQADPNLAELLSAVGALVGHPVKSVVEKSVGAAEVPKPVEAPRPAVAQVMRRAKISDTPQPLSTSLLMFAPVVALAASVAIMGWIQAWKADATDPAAVVQNRAMEQPVSLESQEPPAPLLGAEAFVDLPGDSDALAARVTEALEEHPPYGKLVAAIVMEASPRSVKVMLKDGREHAATGQVLAGITIGLEDPPPSPNLRVRRGAIIRAVLDTRTNEIQRLEFVPEALF